MRYTARGGTLFPALYAILDPSLVSTPLVPFAENLAAAGVRLIQLRDKQGTPRQVFAQARELALALPPAGVQFIVNDRPDIAAISGASGVHVGQEDLPVEDARRIVGATHWVGVSTHSIEQLYEAVATSADYIAVGPVFPTTTKANPDPTVGVELVRRARKLTRKPLVAIGGVTLENASQVFAAGADCIAVIRGLIGVADPARRAAEFLAVAESTRKAQ
jgi:thiamine-phosphate pyrophosphorylase